ncbi:hypothetical protein DFA_00820 [Cavenderia fasciculata]|uniref:Uncharacterized protein n=1 Tax=Cavenderia fasciculata TaxID=261658 RepID=F4PTX2_CACFS|nr:uncharacterized protein DFA_00820 [Cavenderia fasciculata]EGG20951.1 hypothetical protein DFA_00820 [Cavenderia fasciculata]|eukprot:XP_004358801.1 hypothetical protein DFA_00820 [Cavenderia fasciculata]
MSMVQTFIPLCHLVKFKKHYFNSLEFLNQQGITKIGQLAIMEDFIYIEGVFDDPLLEVLQDECRKIVMDQYGVDGLLCEGFPMETLDRHATIMSLNGYTKEDEAFLREIKIITLQHLIDAKNNPLIQNSSRMRFYARVAEKLVNHVQVASAQAALLPTPDIKVYAYVNTATLKLIDLRKNMRSIHAIFEDYIKTEVSTRFNHPWRKIYFKLLNEASAHLGVPTPSDLELYSFFVWKNSKLFQNCVDGQMGIHFFWNEIPLNVNLKQFEVEYEHKITINLTKAIQSGLKVYYSQNANTEWKLAGQNEIKAETKKKYWGFYTAGKDPSETIPHGMLVAPPPGLLSSSYFYTDIDKDN